MLIISCVIISWLWYATATTMVEVSSCSEKLNRLQSPLGPLIARYVEESEGAKIFTYRVLGKQKVSSEHPGFKACSGRGLTSGCILSCVPPRLHTWLGATLHSIEVHGSMETSFRARSSLK
ncbi:uncharacterized protein MYCFIDRAFT_169016 [Pseudocercospora fijiensis CIRAD86]|uniref:Secreted protein n=1 Tax=Pseudocercospora fijiensis (strain CIRAD86) TaxID=383855 RepID=N1Q8G4_PSEFD|nr:uncharacterized protein MYCFIDRAFT_169016 [Pseudocercospora fijiensis CIRAD86]EME87148.1 hypothetical protein MYCFIDRAFT_169016 [Pseudocercospora fijiensis CIRAD86]